MGSPPEFHSEANRASICRNPADEKMKRGGIMYSTDAAATQVRIGPSAGESALLGWTDENKVRTCPERGGNAAAGTGRKNDVVVIGRLKTFDHRRQWLRLGNRQMGEKPVNVRVPVVALGDERNVRILAGEVPAQRSRQCDRVLVCLLGNHSLARIVEYNSQLALVFPAELPHFEQSRLALA